MQASVIIPTRNRADLLRKCLEALTVQALPGELFEVIVVDNGSTDATTEVVAAFQPRLNLVYFYAEEPGLHVGRHAGARLARSDLLIFGDDDIVPCATWVSSIVAAFENQQVVMVGGNNYPLFEVEPPKWLELLWRRPIYKGQALGPLSIIDFGLGQFEIDPNYIWGCNFSIRRKILLESSGFHPDALPESMRLYRGDGESAVSRWVRDRALVAMFDSGASVEHLVSAKRMTKEYFCDRYFSQGISDSYSALRKTGGTASIRYVCKNLVRRFWWRAKSMTLRMSNGTLEAARELGEIERSAQAAYWRGYQYHFSNAKNDPKILNWVLRDSYFE